MKYPKLEEPCKSCLYKCFRVEDPTFVKDEKCKYNDKEKIVPWKGKSYEI